jgi:hypothetical protein
MRMRIGGVTLKHISVLLSDLYLSEIEFDTIPFITSFISSASFQSVTIVNDRFIEIS